MNTIEKYAMRKAERALKSVKESFAFLNDPNTFPLPQDSIAMCCVKGAFVCVPKQVDDALRAIDDCRAAHKPTRGSK